MPLVPSLWVSLVTRVAAVTQHASNETSRYAQPARLPYKLQAAERLVVVNTMIRLPGVIFSGGSPGKEPRETRSGLYIMEEDMYNLLRESV